MSARSRRYGLEHAGALIRLGPSGAVIGRHPGCKVVIDDSRVSRRHARLTVSAAGVVLEDLGSSNGVLVNGARVEGSRLLRHGDQLEVADHRMAFVEEEGDSVDGGSGLLDDLWKDEVTGASKYGEPTELRARAGVLGAAVDEALARGDCNGAQQAVDAAFTTLREAAARGIDLDPSDASRHALHLARTLRDPSWGDRVVLLHLAAQLPMSAALVFELEGLALEVGGLDRNPLAAYAAMLADRGEDDALLRRLQALADPPQRGGTAQG